MTTAVTVVVLLILLNALYVAAEFAAVSSRQTRVRQAAEGGSGAARWVLTVLSSPAQLDRYVACSQVGITLSSLVLGAFGQATLTPILAEALESAASMNPGAALGVAATG
ncbi:MAG: CNNM domain-containing protein, partial [Legionella sp.]|nr:CNNM domain-containing protein [Legionella sp.]